MQKHIVVSSLIGAVVVGGVAAGGFAVARPATEPAVRNASVRHVAPSAAAPGSITFTADVSDDSGVRDVRVLAWPARSKLDPTEAELRHVDRATCRATTDTASRCTYTLAVTREEAAGLEKGTWHVSALATAEDGGTVFAPRAASFDLTG